jgi:hypothetical protein
LTTTPTRFSPFRDEFCHRIGTRIYGARTARGKRRFGAGIYNRVPSCKPSSMIEIVRTNDLVLISFVEALMRDAGIDFMVADQNMSILEGSIGVLPRRVLVADDEAARARRILVDAGIADELRSS